MVVQLTCVYHYFLGLNSEKIKEPSKCIHNWIYEDQYPPLLKLQMEKYDVNILDMLIIEPGSFYIMDRAYLDFERLYYMHQCQAFFVIRQKQNFNYRRLYSSKVDKTKGYKCDQIIKLTGFYTSKKYPGKLRRIKLYGQDKGKTLVFLINNFTYSSEIIAMLYKERWRIKLSIQMDKATFTNKKILRHDKECCIYSNMDCHKYLPTCCHYEKEIKNNSLPYIRLKFKNDWTEGDIIRDKILPTSKPNLKNR